MQDKDKLYIISYLGVGGMSGPMINDIVRNFSNKYKFDDSVIHIIIPNINSSETKIEFFNLDMISKMELDEASQVITKLNDIINAKK